MNNIPVDQMAIAAVVAAIIIAFRLKAFLSKRKARRRQRYSRATDSPK